MYMWMYCGLCNSLSNTYFVKLLKLKIVSWKDIFTSTTFLSMKNKENLNGGQTLTACKENIPVISTLTY